MKFGKVPDGTIFARPHACKQTSVLVENANPIQICSQIWRWVDSYRVTTKRKKHSKWSAFALLVTRTGIERSPRPKP